MSMGERSRAAAEAIARGEISVPLRCGHCATPSVMGDRDPQAVLPAEANGLICLQCGRRTNLSTAHKVRQQEMRMIIAAGVDPRPHHRGA